MTPIDEISVQEKLAKLRTVVDKLEQLRQESAEEFLENFQISDSALHNLTIGVEVIVDIGNHFLAEVYQQKVESYADVIGKLGDVKIVPEKFARENVDMAKFRNLIIHEYGIIDLSKAYEYLQKAPDIFRQFAQYFADFLQRQAKKGD